MSAIERSYSYIYKKLTRAVNPFKKKIIKTECIVHKFINNQSLFILKNDGYTEVYNIMSSYIEDINDGAVWADQDFKSSNHFYNPNTKKGMYGSSNAKRECIAYYKRALMEYFSGDIKTSMFYLGAACHLIQDLTIPQHANVELLNSHRRYENWVIKMYNVHKKFKVYDSGIYLDSITAYVELNSKNAVATYNMYTDITNEHLRFFKITSNILVMAQKTTAGLMCNFFYDIKRIKALKEVRKK
ncbi:zinc dependent phospholipase C family protein [Sedimentibacter saalensis]|jgi:phospholipase C|uniref:Phospholipase C n=1 Tax=Sedimentibacter saalensis TaxID=130788 RepID=A0A562J920_9FIRM|nr:zinc dependent phospholipase C family protein [Sedimentibacter saalensis]MEA5093541.1 zinc dependent phospholipase C family protein [Sedimentibacter saalensis]TWH79425.1 phospholipase C [Sedimentibacter saalensis]